MFHVFSATYTCTTFDILVSHVAVLLVYLYKYTTVYQSKASHDRVPYRGLYVRPGTMYLSVPSSTHVRSHVVIKASALGAGYS